MSKQIQEIYAFVTPAGPGAWTQFRACGEEIIRVGMDHTHMIGPDLAWARDAAPTAQQFADRTGKSFRLVKFTTRTDVTELLR